jgi:hypothetical protein
MLDDVMTPLTDFGGEYLSAVEPTTDGVVAPVAVVPCRQ